MCYVEKYKIYYKYKNQFAKHLKAIIFLKIMAFFIVYRQNYCFMNVFL